VLGEWVVSVEFVGASEVKRSVESDRSSVEFVELVYIVGKSAGECRGYCFGAVGRR